MAPILQSCQFVVWAVWTVWAVWAVWAVALLQVDASKTKHPSKGPPGKISFRLDYATLCPASPPGNYALENMTYHWNERGGMVVNGLVRFFKPMGNVSKASVNIRKCDSSAETSCEHFQVWNFGKETCMLVDQKFAPWSELFQNSVPKMRCPFIVGDFLLRDANINLGALQHLPIPFENNYWRVRVNFFDTLGAFFGCFGVGGIVMRSHGSTSG